MIVWEDISDSFMIGCVAGYSGGGAFQLEKFNLIHENERLIKLQIDNLSILTNENINFSETINDQEIEISENCQDEIIRWHYEENWLENDNLILQQEKIKILDRNKDLFLFSKNKNIFMKKILESIGVNASSISEVVMAKKKSYVKFSINKEFTVDINSEGIDTLKNDIERNEISISVWYCIGDNDHGLSIYLDQLENSNLDIEFISDGQLRIKIIGDYYRELDPKWESDLISEWKSLESLDVLTFGITDSDANSHDEISGGEINIGKANLIEK